MLHHTTVSHNVLDLDLQNEALRTGTPAKVVEICNEYSGSKMNKSITNMLMCLKQSTSLGSLLNK